MTAVDPGPAPVAAETTTYPPPPVSPPPGLRPSLIPSTQLGSRAAGWALGIVAGLAVWVVFFAIGLSALVEHHDQSVLYAQLRQQIATQYAPVSPPIARGAPVAVISAPHLTRQVVVEGTDAGTLRSGPGMYPGYVLPGQDGLAAIFGRSTTYGGPFRDIHAMRIGDRIAVTTGQGSYSYRVVGSALAGQQTPAAFVSATAKMLLVTSDDSGFLGIPTPGRTQYVYAVLVGTPGAVGGIQTPTAADKPNAVAPSGAYPLVLWLQLLLVVALVGTWLLVRGPRKLHPHTWLLGTPLVLVALWGASGALFGVLPNLI